MKQPIGSPSSAAAHAPAHHARPRTTVPPGKAWLAIVLVIALPLAAMWPVCRHNFTTWDDNSTVRDNPSLNPVTLHSLHSWWTTAPMDIYVPMTYTAWGSIALLAREPASATMPALLNPIPFHAANLILHILSGLVVFQLLRLLTGQIWPAAAGALLFGLHPVQVEAVAWVSGLKDVLGGLLALIAIWQYLLAVRRNQTRKPGRIGWHWHYSLAMAIFMLAMLAKPNELVAPALAGILDWLLMRRSWRRVLIWLTPGLVLSAACLIEAKAVQPALGHLNVAFYERPLVAIASIGFYIRKLLWPSGLTVDYGLRPIFAVQSPWLVGDAVVIAAGAIILWLTRRSARLLVTGAVIFIVALMPVMGFVTFDFQSYSNVADHYLYVPMLGVAMISTWIVMRAAARWKGRGVSVAAVIVLAALGAVSYSQTQYWTDTETLFTRAIEVNPASAAGYHSLALVALGQGRSQSALQLAQKSVALRPDADKGYIVSGMALERLHRPDAAVAQYAKALRVNPESEPAMEDLAEALVKIKRFPEAEIWQRQVLRKKPNSAEDHFDLGFILQAENDLPAAAIEFQIAIRLNPHVPQYHAGLAETLAKSGRFRAALEQYQAALRIDPHFDEAAAGRQAMLRALDK